MLKPILRYATLAGALIISVSHAQTLDLKTTLELAEQHDASWSAAQHQHAANKQNLELGKSGLLPRLSIDVEVAEDHINPRGSRSSSYSSEQYGINLRQPLFHLEAWHALRQAQQADSAFDALFEQERLRFYERVLEVYLAVLRAKEELTFRQAEERAIARQLEQTEQRHEVGLIARTDVHEAQAAFDLSKVFRIIAERDLALSLQNLKTLTGTQAQNVTALAADFPIVVPEPNDPQRWVAQALENNPGLLAARNQESAAEYQFRATRARHLPTLDLVGGYTKSYSDAGAGAGVDQSLQINNNLERGRIALNLTIPLYSGGQTSASRIQARSLAYQASDEAQAIALEIEQSTLNLLRIITTDVARVRAQQQVIVSAESALEATQAGYEAGTRTVVDVLAAQQALYAAKKDYATARYNYIANSMRLKQVAGTLNIDDLHNLNAWLR